MREYLTAEDICNDLCMERTVFDGVFMIVEGVTDGRLFGKFADPDGVQITIAHSKDNVREVVRLMATRRRDGRTMGIVDPDLDLLHGRTAKPPLFHTDCRDMEMMAIRSNALDDVLSEYADQDRLRTFEETVGPVREALLSASYPVGLMMAVSQERGLGLSFKDLDFGRFINPRTLGLDAGAMVSEVLDRSRSARIGRRELLKVLNDEARRLDDPWKAARGHDTVDVLLIGLRRTFGSFNASSLNEGALGGALRLAFSDADFEETELYGSTGRWAEERGVALWRLRRRGPGPLRRRRPP